MLNARAALWKEYCRLHDLVVEVVAGHELSAASCRFRASARSRP